MPAPPVRVPTKQDGPHQAHCGGTPVGTPPSARGIAAELPFLDGNPEGSSNGTFSCQSHYSFCSTSAGQPLHSLPLKLQHASIALTVSATYAKLLCFSLPTSMLRCTCLVRPAVHHCLVRSTIYHCLMSVVFRGIWGIRAFKDLHLWRLAAQRCFRLCSARPPPRGEAAAAAASPAAGL